MEDRKNMDTMLLERLETYHQDVERSSLDRDGFWYDFNHAERRQGVDEDEE
jgi:hypothetical protein